MSTPAVAHPARAYGEPLCRASIRTTPADFQVTEILGFSPSGEGEHDFLWIEKTSSNTSWVARQLARYAGIAARDVGFAGLKDRHAVTRQWFSVRSPSQSIDWDGLELDGVRVLDVQKHTRKLRRGSHRGNAFQIVLRNIDRPPTFTALVERYDWINAGGVPNYFGPQRFGRDNLALAGRLFAGKRLRREQRSIALSAARAALFNAILDRRVSEQSWNQLLPGEIVNLDGSGSLFAVEELDTAIQERAARLDVHPTAALWGKPAGLAPQAAAASLERAVAAGWPDLVQGLETAGVDASRRSCRILPRNFAILSRGDALEFRFALLRGAYATSVLREFASVSDAALDQRVSSNT